MHYLLFQSATTFLVVIKKNSSMIPLKFINIKVTHLKIVKNDKYILPLDYVR